MISTRTPAPVSCHAPRLTATVATFATFAVALAGCGDNRAGAAPETERLLALPVVEVRDVPALRTCLAAIAGALKDAPAQPNLACAAGIYRGKTDAGQLCELEVDAAERRFRFRAERAEVAIALGHSAWSAEGRPLHNLNDAGSARHPGIELTRFTGGAQPLTEALQLRMNGGHPELPEMLYQSTSGAGTRTVRCRFGQ